MEAELVYQKLDTDFRLSECRDDWSFMEKTAYLNPEFTKRWMGLMFDFTREIESVASIVFPNPDMLNKLMDRGLSDALVFSHHAMAYDSGRDGLPFYGIPLSTQKRMKEKHLSFYVLHSPLDRNGFYSTSTRLAQALRLQSLTEFCEVDGVKVGYVASGEGKTVREWGILAGARLDCPAKIYPYGGEGPLERIAVAAGGGSYDFVARELSSLGVKAYLTGFTRKLEGFEPSREFHRICREEGISVIGATHAATEKFACMAMTDYFKDLGLSARFVPGPEQEEDL